MTTFHTVQRGRGPLVVAFLVDGSDQGSGPALRQALPGAAIATSLDVPAKYLREDLAEARTLTGAEATAPLVLVGYSRGVQAVRAALVAGVEPEAVVAIDGTHAGLTPPDWQIDVWRELAADARAGRCIAVLTCTLQRYTARLAQNPYLGTSVVLSRALDWPELLELPQVAPAGGYPGAPVAERHEGGLHVYAYSGLDTDKAAHAAQVVSVLPGMLALHIGPMAEQLRDAGGPAAGDLEAALLRHALATVGIHEVGANRGPWIDEAIRACGLEPPQYWCACAWTRWLREACAELGVPMPIPGGAGALAIGVQLVRAGLAVTAEQLLRGEGLDVLIPGATCIWRRPAGGPGAGHINVLERWDGGDALATIGGNQNDSVCRTRDRLSDPLLVCVSRVSRGAIGPSPEALEIAGRQLALSLALEHGAGGLDDLPAVEPMT